jgi:predicted extracellular nuclease
MHSKIIKDIPLISIAEARAAELDTRVNVEGIVTASFYAGGKTNYFVQDATGAIVVRVKGLEAEIGDKIRAKARTEDYFGMPQIQPYIENVEIVEAGVGAPEPKLITSADIGEELEGQLVEIRYATIHSKSKHNDYYGSDMLGAFTLDSDKQYLDVDTTYESIIGVIDYNYGKYKITPRSYDDAIELNLFSKYFIGEESLTNLTESIIDVSQYIQPIYYQESLIKQLNNLISYKNAEQHIPITVQHIMTSLEKLNNGHNDVEVKKIEHELEKIFKKESKQKQ